MNEAAITKLMEHARRCLPFECCGVILMRNGVEDYEEIRNVQDEPKKHFLMHHEDYEKAEDSGQILAICHSHPFDTVEASDADLTMCERTGIPWHIVNPTTNQINTIEPSGYKAPLEGRNFSHGVLDCFTLVKDYFELTLNIILPDFRRDDKWWEQTEGPDLYVENFPAAGFQRIPYEHEPSEVLKPHDVILMEVRSKLHRINHAAIWVGELPGRGGNLILQHCQDQLSGYTVYGGYWRQCSRMVLRHSNLL